MAVKKYYVTVDDASTTRWFKDAKCTIRHRENGPAIEYSNGDRVWYQNGLLHRIDGPAIEGMSRHKEWWQNGQLHRTDGPAIINRRRDKYWYQYNRLHRIDGPAIVWDDGDEWWYINGVLLTEAEFNQAVKQCLK